MEYAGTSLRVSRDHARAVLKPLNRLIGKSFANWQRRRMVAATDEIEFGAGDAAATTYEFPITYAGREEWLRIRLCVIGFDDVQVHVWSVPALISRYEGHVARLIGRLTGAG